MQDSNFLGGFDAKKQADRGFELFKNSLEGSSPVSLNTPQQVVDIRNSFTQKDPHQEYLKQLRTTVTPNTGYMYGAPLEGAPELASFEQKNYNVDELYTEISTGELVKNFPVYTPNIDNYEAFAKSQTNWDKFVNGGAKSLAQFGTGVVGGTVGLVYGIGNGIKEGSFAATYDNDFMNTLDSFNEKLRYTMPNYVSKEDRDLSFTGKLGTTNFWADEFLGGLSFTASAIASEALWAYASGGTSLATTGARMGLSKVDDLIKIGARAKSVTVAPLRQATNRTLSNMNRATNFAKAGDMLNIARSAYTGAGYEAGFEARAYMREMRQNFENDWLKTNGTNPTEEDKAEFEKNLENTANGLFAYNVAIVGSSNIATFGSLAGLRLPKVSPDNWINKKIFGTGVRQVDGFAEAVKATKLQRGLQIGYSLGKGAVVEGLFEEGMQAVGKNTAKNLMLDGYNKDHASESYGLAKAFGKSFSDQYTTDEGLEEIYVGMLIGAFTGNALGIAQSKSLNHEFKDANKRAKMVEEEFGKNATYSSKIAVENMIMTNRVLASKKAEENANRTGDLLGGQFSRNNTIFAQMTRATNLDYLDQTIEATIQEIDLLDEASLAKENGITQEQAKELKESMKEEYVAQTKRFQKVNEFSKYFIGNKFSKEEKAEIEKHYISKGYTAEDAKTVTSDVMSQALSYELFMGEVSHNFADDMLGAFQNEVQNLLGSSRVKNSFNIADVLNKSKVSTRRKLATTKKELEKANKEFDSIERQYRQAETTMAKATTVEARQKVQSELSELLLKKEQLQKDKDRLTGEFNVVYNSAKLENPYGTNNSTELISEEDILTTDKLISETLQSIENLKSVDPQKAERLEKLLQEYEKSVVAFKRYSARTSQMTDPKLGLRGRRGIISEMLREKTPRESTVEMIQGLLDSHFAVRDVVKESLEKKAEAVQKAQKEGVATMTPTAEQTFSVRQYIIDQIKNNPYLYSQIGDDYSEALPTEEEINEYADLFEKDLIEQQPLSEQEKARFEELNTKMANWQLLEAVEGDGVLISDMIKQDVLNNQTPEAEVVEEITPEDMNEIVKNGEVEDNTPRPFSILQTIQNIFVKKQKSGYFFSHITPQKFLETIGQTGEVTYQKIDEKGNLKGKAKKADVSELNDIIEPYTKIFFGNTSITVVSGKRIQVPITTFENDYRQYFRTRNTNSGSMMVFDAQGNPMSSDFKDVDTYSPSEIYNLSNGDVVFLKIDRNDPYNQQLSEEELEDNLKISIYDKEGNKIADLKAGYKPEGQDADVDFLAIRAKAVEMWKTSEEDLIEVGETKVSNVFLGAPNLKLNESNKEETFSISEEQVQDYGYWDGKKTKLKNATKGVRTDLLKGIDKNVPIIVVKEGGILVAYPVELVKTDSMKGDTLLNSNLTDAQLAVQINEALIDAGVKPVVMYYLSVDNQNMRNDDGSPSDILMQAVEKLNKVQDKVDYKTTWFEDAHDKKQLVTEALVNIQLEGTKFLSPKIAVDLASFIEYTQDSLTEEQVTQIITDVEKSRNKLATYGVKFLEDGLVYVRGGINDKFHNISGTYKYIKHTVSGDIVYVSTVGQKNKELFDKMSKMNPAELQDAMNKISGVNFVKTSEDMNRYYKDVEKVIEVDNLIDNNPNLKKRYEQEKGIRFLRYGESQNNKKC